MRLRSGTSRAAGPLTAAFPIRNDRPLDVRQGVPDALGGRRGRRARRDDGIGPSPIEGKAPLGERGDAVPLADGASLARKLVQRAIEHDDTRVLVQKPVVPGAGDHAAAARDHEGAARGDAPEDGGLLDAERVLAVCCDVVGAARAQSALELGVDIDVRAAKSRWKG